MTNLLKSIVRKLRVSAWDRSKYIYHGCVKQSAEAVPTISLSTLAFVNRSQSSVQCAPTILPGRPIFEVSCCCTPSLVGGFNGHNEQMSHGCIVEYGPIALPIMSTDLSLNF